jgi:hypothetical protein
MSAQEQLPEIQMDSAGLYREETITDRRVGTIRCLQPITATGDADSSRSVVYSGQTQIMTPAGALPLSFDIEADSLEAAVEGYGDAATAALEKTMEELREMQREAASSIVVPGRGGPQGGQGGMPGGGLQMP